MRTTSFASLVLLALPVTNARSLHGWPRLQLPPSSLVMKAREIDTESFKELAQGSRPLLVDVYATWCGPCQLMAPHLDQVADDYADRVDVVKIDADVEEELAAYLRVQGLPTLLFISERRVVGRIEGAMMKDEISSWIEHHFFDGIKPSE